MTRNRRSSAPLCLPATLVMAALALVPGAGRAAPGDEAPRAGPPPAEPAYVAPYRQMLEDYTRAVPRTVGTTVDYAALLRPPGKALWAEVKRELAATPLPTGRDGRLALWINAYNALAVDMVLRHYPVESIRDAGGLFSPVWKLDAGVVAGRPVTLHAIEHEILRPMGDPRIHAAIVCASTSCPSLRREPYTALGVDAELDATMRRWLADPQKGMRVDRARKRITVSRIFDWFEEDWDALGGVLATVSRYAPSAEQAWLRQHAPTADLELFDYDWSLNAP